MYTNFAQFRGFYPTDGIPTTQVELLPWIAEVQVFLSLCKQHNEDNRSYLYPARGGKPVLAAPLARDLHLLVGRIKETSMSALPPVSDIMYKIGLLPWNDRLKWSVVSLHSVSRITRSRQ